jgi:hypothetical protein
MAVEFQDVSLPGCEPGGREIEVRIERVSGDDGRMTEMARKELGSEKKTSCVLQ